MEEEKLKNTYIDFSDNLEITWNIFLDNWRTYLIFLIVINLPIAIVSNSFQPVPGSDPDEFNSGLLLIAFINVIFGILLNLAISIITEKHVFRHQINAQSALKKALPKLPISFIIGIILLLIIPIGFLLFIIPGIYLSIIFAFCTQAIALRDCNFDTFKYSYYVVKGRWWKVFGRLLQLGISSLILFLLFFTIPSGLIIPLLNSFPLLQIFTQTIFTLISSIITYFFIIAYTIYFLNLDYLKNGLPLKT